MAETSLRSNRRILHDRVLVNLIVLCVGSLSVWPSFGATLKARATRVSVVANVPVPGDTIPTDAIWVATTGNDSTGNGSVASPYKTIGKGISKLTSGGTVVVKAGTYLGKENFINQTLYAIPAGTATKFTRIRAENPYSVRIENSGGLTYYDNLLSVSSSYVHVDGFVYVLKDSVYPPYIAETSADYLKVTRSIFKRQGACDAYGGFFYVGGSFNLIEDVAGVGHARYGINAGGPSATQSNTIFRRLVLRIDYVSSNQPKAAFSIYGNDGSPTKVKDFLVQNLLVLDSQSGTTAGEQVYGGAYQPKTTENVKYYGAIVLNNQTTHAGIYMAEYATTKSNHLINSVSWANGGAGVRANNGGGDTLWDQITIGQHSSAIYAPLSGAQNIFRNSLVVNSGTPAANAFSTYTNVLTTANPPLRYIVDSETNAVGAKILKRYGSTGTMWGQAGYDQLSNENLWPWPYENQIKAVFAEPNPVPSGALPTTNNTQRGFAASGNDSFGKPLTLTRYIWQYLGVQIPSTIYGP